jgi:hypothetical protein
MLLLYPVELQAQAVQAPLFPSLVQGTTKAPAPARARPRPGPQYTMIERTSSVPRRDRPFRNESSIRNR